MSKRCHHCVKGKVQELVVEVPATCDDFDAYERIIYCPRCHFRHILERWEVDSYYDDYFPNSDGWEENYDSFEAKLSRCSAFRDADGNVYCDAVGSEECDWECGLLDELMSGFDPDELEEEG